MKFEAKTLPELKRMKGITGKEIKEIMWYQTYLNWITGRHNPLYGGAKKETKVKFMELFEIDEVVFRELLENTLKKLDKK